MILFDSISKSFGPNRVLDGLSFTAHDGRVTGFVGPNGAGKSTTFKILLELVKPDAGRAEVDGVAYSDHEDPGAALGAYLGAQQIPGSMTGRSFLAYTADMSGADRSRGDVYLESVGLAEAADRKVSQYSLGMRQRLGVAAAFLGEPHNLVLDEPVNGLDVTGVRWLRDYLKGAAAQGRCIVLSSHLLSELEMVADDVVFLSNGKVSRSGKLSDLQTVARDIVMVSSEDDVAVAGELAAAGFTVRPGAGGIEVEGARINDIAAIAGRSQVPLRSISRLTRRLEDVYLEQVETAARETAHQKGQP